MIGASKRTRGETSRFAESDTLSGALRRVRSGEAPGEDAELRARMGVVFAQHYTRLRALVASELRGFPPEQVEEAVQDVLATAWRRLGEHEGGSFRAWLFGIATHTCANVRRKRRDVLAGEDELFDPASEAASAYRQLRVEDRARLVREAASALDPLDQEIVYMRFELDLSREEIARLAGLDGPDAVRVALQRARRALSRELTARLAALGHGSSLLEDSFDR